VQHGDWQGSLKYWVVFQNMPKKDTAFLAVFDGRGNCWGSGSYEHKNGDWLIKWD
jgi:hypothetical protein